MYYQRLEVAQKALKSAEGTVVHAIVSEIIGHGSGKGQDGVDMEGHRVTGPKRTPT